MSDWVRSNFEKNRETFVELSDAVKASEYRRVTASAIGAYATADDQGNRIHLSSDDATWWNDRILRIGVHSVSVRDFEAERVTYFPTGGNPFWDKRDFDLDYQALDGTLTYINMNGSDEHVPSCDERFAESRCGMCVITLDQGWYAYYTWLGDELTGEEDVESYESCSEDWDKLVIDSISAE